MQAHSNNTCFTRRACEVKYPAPYTRARVRSSRQLQCKLGLLQLAIRAALPVQIRAASRPIFYTKYKITHEMPVQLPSNPGETDGNCTSQMRCCEAANPGCNYAQNKYEVFIHMRCNCRQIPVKQTAIATGIWSVAIRPIFYTKYKITHEMHRQIPLFTVKSSAIAVKSHCKMRPKIRVQNIEVFWAQKLNEV